MRKVFEITPVDYMSINVRAIWTALKGEPLYFWLMCGYIFFEYVRPQSAYPVIAFLPWPFLFVMGALFTRLIDREKKPISNPLTFTQIGFFIVALCASLFAVYPSLSFDRFQAFANWLILYFLFLWIVTTRFRLFIVILLLLLCSFKMSQHAASTWVKRGMSFESWGISGGTGYFGNAADLGVQMLIFVALASAFVVGCQPYWGRYKKAFFYLLPVTAVMAVMATGERGTMLGLVTIGLVMIMAGKQRFRKLLFIGVVGFAIFHIMPDQYKARFETAGTDGTSQARLRYWKRGLEIYADHPVLGIGFNNWQKYYAANYPGESLRREHQEVAHSTPVTLLAEMGTLGFVFFYGMALTILLTNIKTMKTLANSEEDRLWRHIAYGLNLGLCGFLISSCFVTQHEFPFLFVQASITAALYNVIHAKAAKTRRRVGRAVPSPRGMEAQSE